MPASSKALLPRDMQLEIDRWVDRERQTASDTGTDYREAKRTLCIMPVPCKILFYLQKLYRNGEKRPFSPTDNSAMVIFYKSLPQGWLESFSIHVRGNVTFHFQSKGNKK